MTYSLILQTAEQLSYATYLSTGGVYYYAKLSEIAFMPDWLKIIFYGSFLVYVAFKLPDVITNLFVNIKALVQRGWAALRQMFKSK